MNKKVISIIVLLMSVFQLSIAQLIEIETPLAKQFIARNMVTNVGQAVFNYTVLPNSGLSNITIETFQNQTLIHVDTLGINNVSSLININKNIDIHAALVQYRFVVKGNSINNTSSTLFVYDSVLCGDVYIITGQSNAEAVAYNGWAQNFESNFIRTYGRGENTGVDSNKYHNAKADLGYFSLSGVGQLAIQFASKLLDSCHVPICIINGAAGATTIAAHAKYMLIPNSNNTLYGKILLRLEGARLANKARALIFFQGEQDIYTSSINSYFLALKNLIANWQIDIPSLENIYIFQIKLGCGNSFFGYQYHLNIQEAQRQAVLTDAKAVLIATSNIIPYGDTCHYSVNGYGLLAKSLFHLVFANQYNGSKSNVETPLPISANFWKDNSIDFKFGLPSDSYTLDVNCKNDFVLEGTGFILDTVYLSSNNNIKIQYHHISNTNALPSGLTYKGHYFYASPQNITNAKNLNLANFYNFPIRDLKTCDSYFFNGQLISTSGIYSDTFLNVNGFDSIILINIIIEKSITNIVVSACNAYFFNGVLRTTSGIYVDTFTNAAGCDSLVVLQLTINYSSSIIINKSVCNAYFFNWANRITSGTYLDTLLMANGCDSLVILNLTIIDFVVGSINVSSCNPYFFNGQNRTTSGVYLDTFVTANGCDSIVTLNFTKLNAVQSNVNITACNSYYFNGQSRMVSGIYYDTLIGANGCTDIIVLNLTININSFYLISKSVCEPYFFNGQLLSKSGVYLDTFTNVNGCDSFVILNINIYNTANKSVVQKGDYLKSGDSTLTYQWIKCNPTTLIAGATNQTYIATANGSYAVVLSNNGCTDTSACVTVSNVSISSTPTTNFSISPNPTNHQITITSNSIFTNAALSILSATGQLLLSQKNINGAALRIDMHAFASGIYFVEMKENGSRQVVKLVKE
jgi:Carbohydrate esterase, sialic acid-specific acetylesterase/Secretion system C-terminal sorting domain